MVACSASGCVGIRNSSHWLRREFVVQLNLGLLFLALFGLFRDRRGLGLFRDSDRRRFHWLRVRSGSLGRVDVRRFELRFNTRLYLLFDGRHGRLCLFRKSLLELSLKGLVPETWVCVLPAG